MADPLRATIEALRDLVALMVRRHKSSTHGGCQFAFPYCKRDELPQGQWCFPCLLHEMDALLSEARREAPPEIKLEVCPRCGETCPAGWCGKCHAEIPARYGYVNDNEGGYTWDATENGEWVRLADYEAMRKAFQSELAALSEARAPVAGDAAPLTAQAQIDGDRVRCTNCDATLWKITKATPRPFYLTDDDRLAARPPAAPHTET